MGTMLPNIFNPANGTVAGIGQNQFVWGAPHFLDIPFHRMIGLASSPIFELGRDSGRLADYSPRIVALIMALAREDYWRSSA
jgi:hypothetical protein